LDSPIREAIKVIADIIQTELEMDEGKVMIYNQKYNIPSDDGLYIVLQYLGSKAIGNNNYAVATTEGMNEIQEAATADLIQIDIMSPEKADGSNEARARKNEVVMALKSMYAQQQAEKYGISISNIPTTWVDASGAEGTAILTRFSITITAFSITRKIKAAEYFDTFQEPEINVNI
jgi:hypothetical protein